MVEYSMMNGEIDWSFCYPGMFPGVYTEEPAAVATAIDKEPVLRTPNVKRLGDFDFLVSPHEVFPVTATPIDKVLAISELHEMILGNLDMKTLLLSQRVNKQWQTAIEKSVKLQTLLFFRQTTSGNNESPTLNPLLLVAREHTSMFRATGALPKDELCCELHRATLLSPWSISPFSSASRMFVVSSPSKHVTRYLLHARQNCVVQLWAGAYEVNDKKTYGTVRRYYDFKKARGPAPLLSSTTKWV